jgi:hypothetical protein
MVIAERWCLEWEESAWSGLRGIYVRPASPGRQSTRPRSGLVAQGLCVRESDRGGALGQGARGPGSQGARGAIASLTLRAPAGVAT